MTANGNRKMSRTKVILEAKLHPYKIAKMEKN
jgi:hypothetical protein